VRISPNADNARNFRNATPLMGNNCGAHTFTSKAKNPSAKLNMRLQRVKLVKIKFSIAINVEFQPRRQSLVNGFSKDVLNKLPMEFEGSAETIGNIS
jgi:Fe-S cluster assembly protein SufB